MAEFALALVQASNAPLLRSERPFEPHVSIGEFTGSAPDGTLCEFCDAPTAPESVSPFDLTMDLGEIGLKPALGMLVPGYLLAITREHITSFAQFSKQELEAVDAKLSTFERFAGRVLGDSYIRVEHGSDNKDSCGLGSGACVDHAHQHLLPGLEAAERMHAALDWQEIDEYANLASLRGEPYLYLSYDEKGDGRRHFVVPNPRVVSQWARRIIADTYGVEIWDWALYKGAAQLGETFLRLFSLPPGHIIIEGTHDKNTYDSYRRSIGNVIGG